jgi:hypothetical protein
MKFSPYISPCTIELAHTSLKLICSVGCKGGGGDAFSFINGKKMDIILKPELEQETNNLFFSPFVLLV